MPYLTSKLTMNEEVVYGFLALLAKATPIDKGKPPPPKVINRKNFIQSHRPSKESDTRWSLHLPKALPRIYNNLCQAMLQSHMHDATFLANSQIGRVQKS
jgi:hypothetical protein